jgi:uncharacterized membrane protein YphA (DoxX/SURF4 family)
MELLFVIGRVIFASYFLDSAYNHMANADKLAGYAASKKVPQPKASVIFSGFLLAFGGVSVLFGAVPKAGLAALILFIIPVTYMMHSFWKEDDKEKRHHERMAFMKNVMILGAILMLLSVPTPWVASIGS